MDIRSTTFNAVLIAVASVAFSAEARGQSTDYDKLLTQAKTELSAGQTDQALGDSKKAIALQANRWDAHMIAGYALQAEKRYDEAIDEFTNALRYAPADKKADAKRFLEQCMAQKITGGGTNPGPAGLQAQAGANSAHSRATIIGSWSGQTSASNGSRVADSLTFSTSGRFIRHIESSGTICDFTYTYRISDDDHLWLTLRSVVGACSVQKKDGTDVVGEDDNGLLEIISEKEILWGDHTYRRQ